MLKLKKLTISNVGRLVGSHDINLENKSNLIQIDALNKNTGGSSGSGKSTIFNSLEYLLGTNSLPTTVLQSRLTKNPMEVIGFFDFDGKDLKISRSKSNGLSILIDGVEIVSNNNKVAEEQLDKILGVPRELLRKMIHKRQKEGGFFLNLTPKECHSFLIEALDLKIWSERSSKIEVDLKETNNELVSVSSNISSLSMSLEASKKSLETLAKPTIDFDENFIVILEKLVSDAENKELEFYKKLNQELSLLEKPTFPSPVSKSKLLSLEAALKEIKAIEEHEKTKATQKLSITQKEVEDIKNNLLFLNKKIETAKKSAIVLEEVKTKISTIKQGTCPTCKQAWHSSGQELSALTDKAKTLFLEIQSGQEAQKELVLKEEELNQAKSRVEAISLELFSFKPSEQYLKLESEIAVEKSNIEKQTDLNNKAYQAASQLVALKESEIKQKFEKELQALRYDLEEKTKFLTQKKTELSLYKTSIDNFNKNFKTISDLVSKTESSLKDLLSKKEALENKLIVIQDSLTLIKSYTNNLFQSALDNIANKATKILSKIPNMATASIYFEGFKETKSGTIKEEINAILTMDDEIDIPVKSMSGGERTAIDLAVDLAVIDIIEEIAGKGLNLFILDEPFDGLDSVCREQCLEILQTHVSDKKIIVVDHSNETKELVSDRIFVIRDGQESQISDSIN